MGGRTAEADVGARRASLSVSTGRLERVRRPEPRRAPSPHGAAAGRTRTDPLRADPEVYASAGRFPKSCVVRPPLLRCLPPPCLPNASFARSADAACCALGSTFGEVSGARAPQDFPALQRSGSRRTPTRGSGRLQGAKAPQDFPALQRSGSRPTPTRGRGSFRALERHKTSHTPTQRQPGYPHPRVGEGSGGRGATRLPTRQRRGRRPTPLEVRGG